MPLPEAPVNQSAHLLHSRPTLARWANRGTLLLLAIAGAALRFAHLTSKPFWFDECFSVELARLNWSNFLRVLWWREANMALYYLLLRCWLHLGHSEFFIRALSVIAMVAAIPAVYWVAELLYDRRIALIASALFTFNAFNLRYAQEARSYALFLLLTVFSSGCLVLWLRKPARPTLLCYILATILAVYAHLYALLLIAAHWITLRLFGPPTAGSKPALPKLRGAWKTMGLASLPLLIFVAKTGAGPIRWIHRPGIRDLLAFWQQFSGGSNWMLPTIYAAACIAAAAATWKQLSRGDHNWYSWSARFLLTWLLFPIVLTVMLSFARPVFLPRFMIFCQPALAILGAAALARLRQSWIVAPVLAGILLLSLQGIFFVYGHDYDNQRDGSGTATDFILDHAQPGDGILFHIAEARVPYEFFRSVRAGANTASTSFSARLGPQILFPNEGRGLTFADFKARPTPQLLRTVAPDHPRIWVMLIYNQDTDPATTLISRMLPQWFPKEQSWQFPRVEVRLYSKQ
jgi:mannosyltransferase